MASPLSRYNLDKLIPIHKLARKNRIVSVVREYFRLWLDLYRTNEWPRKV